MDIAGQSNDVTIDDNDFINDSLLAEFDISCFNESTITKQHRSSANESINIHSSDLNVSGLCCDEEFSGYDKLLGKKWIYPINYPVRDYQFNIISAALLKNTLVSLPTGLGKTFIAAVLMYNFYRWYPMGKMVFMAPTRPLIAQQIEACYNIIAMPPGDTIEMTGTMNVTVRKENWQTKRVFFATPQVVLNDIKSGICPGKRIRCLVVDEAHKAKSNYAYCHIVSTLSDMGHRTYRILALSATPGSRITDVIQVVKNLQIAHLEMRNENCIDVAPYCHTRNIQIIIVPLDPELSKLRQEYIEILDYYARRLIKMNILKPNLGNLSRGRILMIYKEFQGNKQSHPQRSFVMKDLSQLVSLYHGLELLVKHGSRSFLKYFDEHSEKMWIQSDDRLTVMLERLRDDLGVDPLTLNTSLQPDGTIPEIPDNLNFGHPKFIKVKEIMEEHFKKALERNEDTRAIVFCEYHETVKLVHCLLLQCRPLIKARTFVGQGAGRAGHGSMPQREQLSVMRQFRAGACNALVATCVAEEGLDVGCVDLILCFDVATRSPVRLVQRCGRTGRERTGHVYFLVTEGQEHQTLLDGMQQRDSLKARILQSKEVQDSLYKLNPRMVPYDVTPKCETIHVTVRKQELKGKKKRIDGHPQDNKKENKKKKKNSPSPPDCNRKTNLIANNEDNKADIRTQLMQVDPVINASPSKANKGNILITNFVSPTKDDALKSTTNLKQKKKSNLQPVKPISKNGDIRTLFLTANKPQQSRAMILKELQAQDTDMPMQYLDLLISIKADNATTRSCIICENICNCQIILNLGKKPPDFEPPVSIFQKDKELVLPDLDLIKNLDFESIMKGGKTDDVSNAVSPIEEIETHFHNATPDNSDFTENCKNELKQVCERDENQKTFFHSNHFEIGDPEDIFVKDSEEEIETKENRNDALIFPQNSNFDLGCFDDILGESNENSNSESVSDNNQVSKHCEDYLQRKEVTDNQNKSPIFGKSNSDSKILLDSDKTQKVENSNQLLEEDKKLLRNEISVHIKESPESMSNSLECITLESDANKTLRDHQMPNESSKEFGNYDTVDLTNSPDDKEEYKPPRLRSPSILSGTSLTRSKSPILTSQRKTKTRNKSTEGRVKKKLNLDSSSLSNSMLTITQTIDFINTSDEIAPKHDNEDRSLSPVLTTQLDRRKLSNSRINNSILNNSEELSHSDISLETLIRNKRKVGDDVFASPYFNKKQKLDNLNHKPLDHRENNNIQSIIKSVLERNDIANITGNEHSQDDETDFNCLTQMTFRNNELAETTNRQSPEIEDDRILSFNLSSKFSYTPLTPKVVKTSQSIKPRSSSLALKRRKKIKNEFIDSEASLSGDDGSASADELSDSSAGSVADFVTDNDVTRTDVDIHALYLKTTRSPLKLGAFKIPQLPPKMKNKVLSQFIEHDSYEMDSFCVDSHIGLTQANDLSNLEIAEMILEEERKRRKNNKNNIEIHATQENGDSPVIKRKNQCRRYAVFSDSDDSS